MTIYSLKNLKTELKGVNNITKALEVKTPSVAMIRRQYGERFIEAYIKLWLIDLNEIINATRPLKEFQIDETAGLIVSEYFNLTIADINVIFRNAKLGVYGDLYGTLSINKILTWFSEYFNERCEVASSNSRRKADQQKYRDERYWGDSRQCTGKIDEDFRKFKSNYIAEKFNEKSGENGAD